MPDTEIPEDEMPPVNTTDPWLDAVKAEQMAAVASYLDSVGANIRTQFPQAEQLSWPFQMAEAQAFAAAGESATLELTPFLASVCEWQFGEATPAERLQQVTEKVPVVLQFAQQLLGIAAVVNGLRAKAQDLINAAEDAATVYTIRSEISTQMEDWRAQHNV